MNAALRFSILLSFAFFGFSSGAREKRCGFRCDNNWERSNQLPIQRDQSCPCVKAPGSTQCVSYDPRLQAATIDEALFSFPDLASYSLEPQTFYSKQKAVPIAFNVPASFSNAVPHSPMSAPAAAPTFGNLEDCTTPDCMQCKLKIINGFLSSCPLATPGGCNNSLRHSSLVEEHFKLENLLGGHDDCQRIYALSAITGFAGSTDPEIEAKNRASDAIAEQIDRILEQLSPKPDRKKRAFSEQELRLGMETKINCPYRRGNEISADSMWTGLCNICWKWRKLADNYFPAYLNEVSCDSADRGCLNGWGECRPIHHNLDVLRFASKEDRTGEVVSILTTAACECQVKIGTGLHSFITR